MTNFVLWCIFCSSYIITVNSVHSQIDNFRKGALSLVFRSKHIKKGIAALLVFTFSITDVLGAAAPTIPQSSVAPAHFAGSLRPASWVEIPEDLGEVIAQNDGSGPLVICIQDAHGNVEAQHHIGLILKHLNSKYGLSLYGVEGAEGRLPHDMLSAFPDQEARRCTAEFYLLQGKLSGAEAQVIGDDLKVQLYGLEDLGVYRENRGLFRKISEARKNRGLKVVPVQKALARIGEKLYNAELREFIRTREGLGPESSRLQEYVDFLLDRAGKLSVSGDYPALKNLKRAQILERELNFTAVREQLEDFIHKNASVFSGEAKEEWFSKAFLGRVEELIHRHHLSIEHYPDLTRYLEYLSLTRQINHRRLFNEISECEKAIKEVLFQNDEERYLDRMSSLVRLLHELLGLELPGYRMAEYRELKKDADFKKLLIWIKEKEKKYGLHYSSLNLDFKRLEKTLSLADDFYRIAVKRDKILASRMLKQMKKQKIETGAMVIGGFHAGGVQDYFEKRGVRYVSIVPKINHPEIYNPYLDRMLGRPTRWDKVIDGWKKDLRPENSKIALESELPNEAFRAEAAETMIHTGLDSVLAPLTQTESSAAQMTDAANTYLAGTVSGWQENLAARAADGESIKNQADETRKLIRTLPGNFQTVRAVKPVYFFIPPDDDDEPVLLQYVLSSPQAQAAAAFRSPLDGTRNVIVFSANGVDANTIPFAGSLTGGVFLKVSGNRQTVRRAVENIQVATAASLGSFVENEMRRQLTPDGLNDKLPEMIEGWKSEYEKALRSSGEYNGDQISAMLKQFDAYFAANGALRPGQFETTFL